MGCLRLVAFVALLGALVVFVDHLRTPGVATVERHREAYRALVDVLAERADAEGLDVVMLDRTSLANQEEWTEGALSAELEELGVSCVLYVHERWFDYQQRGVLVAGETPAWWGDAKTRAYKLVNGRFERWPRKERPRGPIIYKYRHPMDGEQSCSTSG